MKLNNPELLRSQCLINGEWCDALSGQREAVINPATGAELASIPLVSEEETQQAINAAQLAQQGWKQLTAKQRSVLLLAWADKVLAAQEDLAQLMTAEQGKSLAEARGEVAYAASFITWFAEEAKRVDGAVLQAPLASQRLVVVKQPIGVCAAITPWNFPAAMITRKVAPALAAGCAMIVKPAEQTPLTALALAKLAQDAGIPPGVLQVVTGDAAQVGKVLCDSPVVRKLSFTGSTEVGRILMAQCAPTIKKLSLELGGNAPVIVFDDANLDAAVAGIMASKFRNSGQTCVCANRIYVQDGIYDRLVDKLVAAVEQLKVGDGSHEGTTQGPLIDQDAVDKVQSHIDDALIKGAQIAIGGQPHELGRTFFQPTVVTGVTQKMRFAREETFGPVAPLFRFHDEAEAIAMANDTEFGLAAYLFTQSASRQWRVPEALEYGMVGINTGLISNEVAPFGGVKQSGLGREGSRYGIEEYLELKYLCIDVSC
ncbi:NAD-dependent succinate-semialdehyde dehydrogenase [Serratia plymuthica]|jgi:succinate-semialdehyde dehydrogenase/glutarate-semialdehyde dehydrogenase|uniref:NAD-dependent succinate-semialdehyde dehydrogenase n=1 Tax=Serratia plymuthica TaxID=82996 RepID=A0A2X4UZU5_SERPL|nr:NAD-dependent succinate-semialdehyde dehydrogenase [Serratia plymuthica]AGO57062.1 succinate-semialdehyde dehydrogenase [NADp(+)] GabD [Serratia plymuthica 4Rx13]AHY09317.1 succinate-semialdehyde dehydrogenase [Serratia plymuthica]ANJ94045.1 succinate-semialdehyde dehydrogenase [Serratia plymuthica]EKF62442.1 succinate-semialdehyde dehydrogenase [Serratia plymuthica A30]MBL3522692.1 NAD-dependent succinate-semialdehyde dehydrogenase [Serratia plymuthica]